MTDPDEEFHQKLLATFREEVEEHLGEITEELIALEKAGITPGSPLVERVYRKTPSLKGSARAVNLKEIESVCQNLESVFSLMKKREFVSDEAAFDLFHDAIKITRGLLSGESSLGLSPPEVARSLRTLVSGTRDLRTIPQVRPAPGPASATRSPVTAEGADKGTAGQAIITERVSRAISERFLPDTVKPGPVA